MKNQIQFVEIPVEMPMKVERIPIQDVEVANELNNVTEEEKKQRHALKLQEDADICHLTINIESLLKNIKENQSRKEETRRMNERVNKLTTITSINEIYGKKKKLYFSVAYKDRYEAKEKYNMKFNGDMKKWYTTIENPKFEEIRQKWSFLADMKDLDDEPTCTICMERYTDMPVPENEKYGFANVEHYRYHLTCCNHYICANCYENNPIRNCPLCRIPTKHKMNGHLGIQEYFPEKKNASKKECPKTTTLTKNFFL